MTKEQGIKYLQNLLNAGDRIFGITHKQTATGFNCSLFIVRNNEINDIT